MTEMTAAAPPATDNPPAPPDNAAPAPPESPDPSSAAAAEATPAPTPPKPRPLPAWLLDRENSMAGSTPTQAEGRVVLMFHHPIISMVAGCEPDMKVSRQYGLTGRGAGMPHREKAQRARKTLKENGQAAAGPHKANARTAQAREAAIRQRREEIFAQLAAACEPLVQELVDLAFEERGMAKEAPLNY